MNQKASHPTTMNQRSSLQKFCKLQRKICDYIKSQSTVDISSDAQTTNFNAEKIPQKLIGKNKLISSQKNITNHRKFDWLTKSVQNSKQQSNSSKLLSQKSSVKESFSNLKKIRCKTDTLISKTDLSKTQIDFLSGWNQKTDKLKKMYSIHEAFDNSFSKENRPQTPQKSRLINQENSFQLLKEIQVNKKMMIKSQSFQLKQFKTIPDKENCFHSLDDKQNLKKVFSNQQRKHSFVKRKKILQSQNRIERNLEEKQKSSKFLLSGFNPKESVEEGKFFDKICDQKLSFQVCQGQKTKKCIKNLKKEYICLSKESKKQQSEYLKRNKKIEQEIKVEPWNFVREDNEEDYEVIRLQ